MEWKRWKTEIIKDILNLTLIKISALTVIILGNIIFSANLEFDLTSTESGGSSTQQTTPVLSAEPSLAEAEENILVEKEDGGSTGLEDPFQSFHLSPVLSTPQTISASAEIRPGFFYRRSATSMEVSGVYAKSIDYYGEDLFIDETPMEQYTFSQDSSAENGFVRKTPSFLQ